MQIGVIADDFTGGTDIAGFFVKAGLKTIQLSGIPNDLVQIPNVDAVVISLKSRSCPQDEAIADSLDALRWLKKKGAERIYFKYCSTFDSTHNGNIGPVTDALMKELDVDCTIVCPALPINGRTVFNGHLFVNNVPLNESSMKDHPITPMLDSCLVRLMTEQSIGSSGLVNYKDIEKGSDHIEQCILSLQNDGYKYIVVDSFDDKHLEAIATVASNHKFITGGSGLGYYIAKNIIAKNIVSKNSCAVQNVSSNNGGVVIFSGSCSEVTNEQVSIYRGIAPSLFINIDSYKTDPNYLINVVKWVLEQQKGNLTPLIYATSDPVTVTKMVEKYPSIDVGALIEKFFGALARLLKEKGISKFIVAGGETSGVVTQSLHIDGLLIGQEIAPGVPWVTAIDNSVSLALKSGNFGSPNFFQEALQSLKES